MKLIFDIFICPLQKEIQHYIEFSHTRTDVKIDHYLLLKSVGSEKHRIALLIHEMWIFHQALFVNPSTENILSACISLLENGPMPLKEKKEENGRREDSLSLVLLTNCGNADN
jgi:hypothetical protein